VKVVLKELKAANMLDQQSGLARVWWIGAGVASSFPFHAAASSFDNYESKEDTLSKMVPSYTPSIKALSHSRENSRKYAQIEHKERKLTIVTMPKTPGQARLPGVENESNSISKICDGFYACTELWEPTASAVLKSIVKSEIVHFACHGMSHVGDPSKSHLLLQKAGDSGPVVDELTVSKLLSVEDASLAWIAYVSACSTAQISASKLADEGIHISSALQIAGFAHVIGSLWRVDDGVCVKVASKFYKALIESQSQQLCNRAVAEALRSAVLNVRAQNLELWKWGAYIHSGA
jgi:CHAT domain-containing protein